MEALEEYDPVALQTYPSAVLFLAGMLDSQGRRYGSASSSPRKLRAIVTSSETLLPEQRKLIERVFGCRVFDWYGSFERVAAIGTCEHGNYHLLSDYGHAEILDSEQGGEVIGTGVRQPRHAAVPLPPERSREDGRHGAWPAPVGGLFRAWRPSWAATRTC